MIYLDQYISLLLNEHECVIVPGFGAFITNNRTSVISRDGLNISPPTRILAFNPSLVTNDGLLVHCISQFENIGYIDALNLINKTISDWRMKLNEKQRLLFLGIGELFLNEENKLIFSPLGKNNYSLESFGLEELEVKPISREKIQIPGRDFREFERKSSKSKKKRKILVYSLTGYLPLLLILWVVLFYKEPFGKVDQSSLNIIGETLSLKKADESSMPKPVKTSAVIKFKKEVPVKANTVPVNTNVNNKQVENLKSNVNFYIIGGSFKTQGKAGILQREFKNKNYKSEIIKSEIGQFRVTYNKFSDRQSAISELQKIRQSENPSAWLLTL